MTASQGIQQLAMSWLVLDLTGSLSKLGIVIFVQGVPTASMSLFGGVLADRYSRKKLLIYSQAFTMVNLFILATLTLTDAVSIWHVYVSSMILGLTQALTMPARQALIRALVDEEDLINAVALNTVQQNSARIIWPTIAGGLIVWLGTGASLLVCALCYVVGIVFLLLIRGLKDENVSTGKSAVSEIMEGFRYVASAPLVGTVVLMMCFIGAFGLAFGRLGPAFGREALGFDAGVTGLFMMASGVGSIIGSSVLLMYEVKNRTAFFVTLSGGFALSLLGLAVSPWTVSAFVFMGLFGVCQAGLVIVGQTIFQLNVPDRLLGRVMAVWSLTGGFGSLSALPLGIAGDVFGLRWALGAIALLLLGMTLLVGVVRAPWRSEAKAAGAV